jgi:hypothetical protein
MDRKWLEEYQQEEKEGYDRLLKRIEQGEYSFVTDRFPPDERFPRLQKPVALASAEASNLADLCAQIPFSGSLILPITNLPQSLFEETVCKVSEIPNLIDFIKDTGRLQIVLCDRPTLYEGLDHLDGILKELRPPVNFGIPYSAFTTNEEIEKTRISFTTLGKVSFFKFLRKWAADISSRAYEVMVNNCWEAYYTVKIERFQVLEEVEKLMVDEPEKAFELLTYFRIFIAEPLNEMRIDVSNFALQEIRHASTYLPSVYKPEMRFPCEIGKFLLKRLTYAPQGLDACKELIYHYDAYDLKKVQASLNEGIVTNSPDVVNKSAKELSEILYNVWSEKTIPRRIKSLRVGLPLSMAAIGSVAAGPIGAAGGFLAGLGFEVGSELLDLGTEGLSEKLAKLKTKSYQANIYDFKEKYKHVIPQLPKDKGKS